MDKQFFIKSLALGAGAVGLPALLSSMASTLSSIPFWNTTLWSTVTLGAVVLAGAGAGLVDRMFFNR